MHSAVILHNPTMNKLDPIRIFLKVAELESFSGAAQQLGLPNTTVSANVRELEEDIGVRLLQRTTRRVKLTQEGAAFYARSRDLLDEFDELGAMFDGDADGLTGRLRVDLTVGIAARIVLPRLKEFMARHPRLEINLSTTDRRVDVVREGFDCVLRSGLLADSSLVARPLGSYRMVNCASPAYLEAFGTPRTLADLAQHRIVHYDALLGGSAPVWEWFDGERTRLAPVGGMLTVNGTACFEAACRAGLGLIQAPDVGIRAYLDSGELIEVLPDFRPEPMPVAFVYPSRRYVPARTLAFMEWVQELLAPYLEPR